MTPERAREIRVSASRWPYWGNYSRFMTADEIEEVRRVWDTLPGNTSFADALESFESSQSK